MIYALTAHLSPGVRSCKELHELSGNFWNISVCYFGCSVVCHPCPLKCQIYSLLDQCFTVVSLSGVNSPLNLCSLHAIVHYMFHHHLHASFN